MNRLRIETILAVSADGQRCPSEAMCEKLPEDVVATYRDHFRRVREDVGSTLHDVLKRFGSLDQNCELLLSRITDWRTRYAEELFESDRMIICMYALRTDVQNGGFQQYFINSASDLWPDVLRVLELGNDPESLAHFKSALSVFPGSNPSLVREERDEQMRLLELDEKLDVDGKLSLLSSQYDLNCYPSGATLYDALLELDDHEFVPDPDAEW